MLLQGQGGMCNMTRWSEKTLSSGRKGAAKTAKKKEKEIRGSGQC